MQLKALGQWMDGISTAWKAIAVLGSGLAVTFGAVKATAAVVQSLYTVHLSQTDLLVRQMERQVKISEAQLCVATHPKSEWNDCLRRELSPQK